MCVWVFEYVCVRARARLFLYCVFLLFRFLVFEFVISAIFWYSLYNLPVSSLPRFSGRDETINFIVRGFDLVLISSLPRPSSSLPHCSIVMITVWHRLELLIPHTMYHDRQCLEPSGILPKEQNKQINTKQPFP